jgi:hypothetical protein
LYSKLGADRSLVPVGVIVSSPIAERRQQTELPNSCNESPFLLDSALEDHLKMEISMMQFVLLRQEIAQRHIE